MKILLLDTAFAAAPIYNGLIEAGNEVWVMGNRAGDLLARVADDRWIDQNYSDVDSVNRHIDRLGIERVVPGCTDVSIETCVQLSLAANLLDSAEINQALGHKGQFRSLCAKLNLPAPLVLAPASFPRPGTYISKPVDAFSGRGITVFDGTDMEGLTAAIAKAEASSRTGQALIEEYVGDALYSCSGFLKNCKFTDVFFVREGASANPFAVDTSYVVDDMQTAYTSTLTDSLERLARHLGLRDGLLHTQFILSQEGPKIIEVSRRCPGDLYPMLIQYSTGFPFARKYAACCAGYDFDASSSEQRSVLRHTVTANSQVEYGGLVFKGNTPIRAFYPIVAMGEELLARQGNRAGVLFTEYTSKAELQSGYALFMARESYRVTGALDGIGFQSLSHDAGGVRQRP